MSKLMELVKAAGEYEEAKANEETTAYVLNQARVRLKTVLKQYEMEVEP